MITEATVVDAGVAIAAFLLLLIAAGFLYNVWRRSR